LFRFKDGKFTVYTAKEGLSNDSVSSIAEDREGRIWIGTDGGVLNAAKLNNVAAQRAQAWSKGSPTTLRF
jgi:ligand-binding sensor domain-containing protein